MNVTEILNDLPSRDMAWLDSDEAAARLAASLVSSVTREQWKYTPIKGFVESFAHLAIPVSDTLNPVTVAIDGIEQPQIRLTRFSDATSEDLGYIRNVLHSGIFVERYPLADLTALTSGNGLFIQVLDTPEHPLVIDFSASTCTPVVISVAANVHLELIETASAAGFHTQFIRLDLGEDAVVHHARSALTNSAGHWSLLQASVSPRASYSLQSYTTGAQRRRIDTQVFLQGRGASVEIDGAYLVEDGCHLDQQTIIEHQAPDTFSKQLFHGIGLGKSKTTFNGRIHIHRDAPRSDAALTNKNLALDPRATINTKPELEIYTDDVKCSHGATVGQLSEDAVFYLRSRGLADEDARALLATAFLKTCLHGPLAETVEERFLEALSRHSSDITS
ncbi:MAG: SufD family Fe-S cluster assembly protein [Gammaproteobacteria bacterium]|nr:SufD family Fe-S cluster assembly protein [Gammaproteobacteria bacterium]